MSGTVPLLPSYDFTAWALTTLPLLMVYLMTPPVAQFVRL